MLRAAHRLFADLALDRLTNRWLVSARPLRWGIVRPIHRSAARGVNMKTLVVYYSLSGNNRLLAEAIGKRLDCEVCELQPKKPRTKLDLMIDAFLYRTPPNKLIPYDIGAYDRVVLVAPVWNARLAAPMRSFARKSGGHLGNYSFITACGGRPAQTMRLHRELTRIIGRGPRQLVELEAQQLLPPAIFNGLRASRYRLNAQDIVALAPQIDRFVEAIGGREPPRARIAPNAQDAAWDRSYHERWSNP